MQCLTPNPCLSENLTRLRTRQTNCHSLFLCFYVSLCLSLFLVFLFSCFVSFLVSFIALLVWIAMALISSHTICVIQSLLTLVTLRSYCLVFVSTARCASSATDRRTYPHTDRQRWHSRSCSSVCGRAALSTLLPSPFLIWCLGYKRG